ncbi:GTPase [Niveibacterium umoris]|uniref:G3E family GTPase n=1 Tax=Niveibacterium umoris TaxID=1193620 RepID=A0A840BQ92_9RHOO|nr:GTP-binding protein [Niveibacterium umoris]MBB4014793.1 G3E family GTPase [Niveibacterium umoris]
MNPNATPIPVTVLTGFLGAGKTTLLNRLLAAPHGQRIAVVENEFGAESIDGDLVGPGATTVVELSNGCICCSVQGELSAALIDLAERREMGLVAFDRLIIETTGLADPGPVIQNFFWDETLRGAYALDGVITLVDACHAITQIERERVATAQIAYADRLLVTKTDCKEADAPGVLFPRLRDINLRAPLLRAGSPDEDWFDLFNIGGFSLDERGLPPRKSNHGFVRSGAVVAGVQAPRHDAGIGSVVLEADGELDLDEVSSFVEALIETHANDLLRYKGILSIAGEARRLIFQGVHRIAGFDYGRAWAHGEQRDNRIVLIGRGLPFADLQQRFAALAVAPASA